MATTKSQVTGIRELRRKLKQMPDETKNQMREVFEENAREIHERGIANYTAKTDDRTGRLRSLYRYVIRKGGLRAAVGVITKGQRKKVFYWKFVHYGSPYRPANPFHTKAVEEVRPKYDKRMRQAVRLAIWRAGLRD